MYILLGTKPIGGLRIEPLDSSVAPRIRSVWILPELRNQGFCKELLSKTLTHPQTPSQLYLDVKPSNSAAYHVYERSGFAYQENIIFDNEIFHRMLWTAKPNNITTATPNKMC